MDMTDYDPGALSASLDLHSRKTSGNVWIPTKLWSIDVVRIGDAVNDLLSVKGLPPFTPLSLAAQREHYQRRAKLHEHETRILADQFAYRR
jgi:hypothetical protein